jgi:hypothetical protein
MKYTRPSIKYTSPAAFFNQSILQNVGIYLFLTLLCSQIGKYLSIEIIQASREIMSAFF